MVATREGPETVGEWMYRLFRRQHEDKFLSSFAKLGLGGLPDAVACARYHVLSNSIGGVAVEYMEESDTKDCVRFRYPRWLFDGPVICGVPVEASRGFLKGWYAQNGVSLENLRLGFVCVSEDMTGQFGFCGYFKEYDHDLTEEERLQFAPMETPPPFDPEAQPKPPTEHWSAARLAKANRNYAVEYIRNGIRELAGIIGRERTRELGSLAARLTGLQHYHRMAEQLGAQDGNVGDATDFLVTMFEGMGDIASVSIEESGERASISHCDPRVLRGLEGNEREDLLACWIELWRGAVHSHRAFMDVDVTKAGDDLEWSIQNSQKWISDS
jgi:hypothetical protein